MKPHKQLQLRRHRFGNLHPKAPVLEQESKAASVAGINKMKAIHDFIIYNVRI